VPGGSANAYDYANADPVNGFDLTGEWPSNIARWLIKNANKNRALVFRIKGKNALRRYVNHPSLINSMRRQVHKWTVNDRQRIENTDGVRTKRTDVAWVLTKEHPVPNWLTV
jgi:hypothetical protein